MIAYYLEIRQLHIALAIATGALFLARGTLVLAGRAPLANQVVVRYLSYTIDTALLTAALMLLTMLRLSPLESTWLGAKILLLAVYVVAGSYALRRAATPRGRQRGFAVALLAYAMMLGIARAHDPRGWFTLLSSNASGFSPL